MSKKKTEGLSFKDAKPELIKKVEGVIAEAAAHKYSVSRVYAAHNTVFDLNETPQTCASCLKSRAEALKKWYAGKKKTDEVPTTGDKQLTQEELDAQALKDSAPAITGEAVTYKIGDDAQDVHFTPDENVAVVKGSKGTVKHADGSAVKTGTYQLSDGTKLAVSVGGKAAIK